jgi:hypothetical protein
MSRAACHVCRAIELLFMNRTPSSHPSPQVYVFSLVSVKPNGARRSRRFRVAQTRSRRGKPEALEFPVVKRPEGRAPFRRFGRVLNTYPPVGEKVREGRLKGIRCGSWSQCMRKNERERSMTRRVLPASCRQWNRRETLPTRRRQHLVGSTVSLVRRPRAQCMRKAQGGCP